MTLEATMGRSGVDGAQDNNVTGPTMHAFDQVWAQMIQNANKGVAAVSGDERGKTAFKTAKGERENWEEQQEKQAANQRTLNEGIKKTPLLFSESVFNKQDPAKAAAAEQAMHVFDHVTNGDGRKTVAHNETPPPKKGGTPLHQYS